MELFPCIPDPFDQICLNKTVNIFIFLCNLKSPVLHIRPDTLKSFYNLLFLFLSQDSLLREHRYMSDTSADILFIKSLIERDRCIEIIYQFVRLFCKTAAP